MSARTVIRLGFAALAAALGLAPVLVPSAAHAGQVGVTIGIQGSGWVKVVEGSLEDGASEVCDKRANRDHRVLLTCPRIRNEEPFEAWVWLRPTTYYSPPFWEFVRWTGCDQTRQVDGVTECGVGSPAFGSVDTYPVAVFRDTKGPTISNLNATQGGSQGSFTYTWLTEGEILNQCRLDTGAWETCSSPHTVTLPEGHHDFAVRGEDESGNIGNQPSVEVSSVDATLWRKPAYLSNSRTAQFDWSTKSASSYECILDGVVVACSNEGSVRFDNLGEGWHTFTVRGRAGGWVDPTPARWDWEVDTIAPETTLSGGPAEGSTVGSTSVEFTVGTNEAGTEIACLLDGAPLACARGVLRIDALAPGSHTLVATARDDSGNADPTPASRTWTVDGAAPDTTLTGGPAQGSIVTTTSAGFRLGATEPGATIACTLDGRARACAPGALGLTGLAPGTHVLTARATDAGGNTDATAATRTWTVPAPASALGRKGGFTIRRSPGAYAGAVLSTTRKGATATYAVRDARRLALIVGSGKGHGKVEVYAGKRLLRTVSLKAARTQTNRVVTLPSFSAPWTGTVRVVVVTKGKPVRLEGVAAPTR